MISSTQWLAASPAAGYLWYTMSNVRPSVFSRIVQEVLDDLPERFHPFLENVSIQVADEPDPDQVSDGSFDDGEVLGLYVGSSLLGRGAAGMGLPDEIWIFRGPLLRVTNSMTELRKEIRPNPGDLNEP